MILYENEDRDHTPMYVCVVVYVFGSIHQWSGRPGFNPSLGHTKDFKNGTLLNTQNYKVPIKGKVDQSRGTSSALPDTSV